MKELGDLVGKTVEAVEVWPGCPCVLRLQGDYRILIDCLWRVVDSTSMRLASTDDGLCYGHEATINAIAELSGIVKGLIIDRAVAREATGDLVLGLGNLDFEALSTSSGYEAWQIYCGNDIRYVAVGGGGIRQWP